MLTIVNVAYPLAPVGPETVGGAEQILHAIDAALVAAGHRSLVIAQEGSRCHGHLEPIPRVDGPFDASRLAQAQIADGVLRALHSVLERERVDVIHFHGVDCASYIPRVDVPRLVTLHLMPERYDRSLFERVEAQLFLHGVSNAQHRRLSQLSQLSRLRQTHACQLLPPIENGVEIPIEPPPQPARRRNMVVAIGRVCLEKGFHLAIDAARAAGVPIVIAGDVFPYPDHATYWRDLIQPRLLAGDAQFLGPIGPQRKRQLLASARALLVSSVVEETSSLVAMEALAVGTPVIGFRKEAIADIIDDGRTGFIVEDVDQMAAAIRRVDTIDRDACVDTARQRFSRSRMMREYFTRYEQIRTEAASVRARSAARQGA
jgi:glycosyltransferase involved in cell wall biosynthesis